MEVIVRNPPAALVSGWSAVAAVLDTVPLADMLATAALLGRANRRRLRFDHADLSPHADRSLPSAA